MVGATYGARNVGRAVEGSPSHSLSIDESRTDTKWSLVLICVDGQTFLFTGAVASNFSLYRQATVASTH